ncbi:hypothetical protein M427DRAFT_38387 [Gonapodya prolifera JEL478]|uniref:Uncharacterized protein n=1 Tax=Gonapodya prolifera (strain JEL478) TaxID=1344416 RepID=A0A138ZZP7_GONPJ|nr:hypothetical protein M427DRAFT_38387 [Gonapodya prolifera JEL478]|eukprot:KXS09745.1 hypothetical protein M427DRAFT_38387 [Gonapodya prolifera JEL478]
MRHTPKHSTVDFGAANPEGEKRMRITFPKDGRVGEGLTRMQLWQGDTPLPIPPVTVTVRRGGHVVHRTVIYGEPPGEEYFLFREDEGAGGGVGHGGNGEGRWSLVGWLFGWNTNEHKSRVARSVGAGAGLDAGALPPAALPRAAHPDPADTVDTTLPQPAQGFSATFPLRRPAAQVLWDAIVDRAAWGRVAEVLQADGDGGGE